MQEGVRNDVVTVLRKLKVPLIPTVTGPEVLMNNIPGRMLKGLAMHHYMVFNWRQKGSAIDFTEQQYFNTMKSALLMYTLVTRYAAIMDKYDPQKRDAMIACRRNPQNF